MTHKSSGTGLNGEMKELAKVLPDLQANIRRFLAVRKYKAIKEEKKKVELKEKKERQKNRMSSLSRPRAVVPTPPRAPKGKSISSTSPAMQNRTKTSNNTKKTLKAMEYYQKYGILNDNNVQNTANKTVELPVTDVISGEKFDENITSLMKNINQITLTLNMHDSTLLPKTVDKGKKKRNDSLHGYFTFGQNSSTTTTGTSDTASTDIQMRSNMFPLNTPERFLASQKNPSSSPPVASAATGGADAGVGMYSEKVQEILSAIQAEYATLSRTNEHIKQALARSTSQANSKHTSPNKQEPDDGLNTSSPHKSLGDLPHNTHSPSNKSPTYNSSSSHYKQPQQQQPFDSQTESSGSSLVTVDSGAYIPIRRSGNPQLDSMVQETLIRANNSIIAQSIPEHEEYDNKDAIQSMLHNVVLQLNNTFMDMEDSTCRKDSHSSVDSIGLDALTRSISALQAQNHIASTPSTISTPYMHSQYNSTIATTEPSQENSANNSHNNSMDSHTSNADSCDTNHTTVSELTIAIKDILANLSGGIFERAKLEFSSIDSDFRHSSPTHIGLESNVGNKGMESLIDETHSVASTEGGFGESILSKVREEMGGMQPVSNYQAPSSSSSAHQQQQQQPYVPSQEGNYPPLLMQSYLDSVYAQNSTHTAIGNAQKLQHKEHPSREEILKYVPSLDSSPTEQEQERADLYVLLQHQERSMQLIRDSMKAIEQTSGLQHDHDDTDVYHTTASSRNANGNYSNITSTTLPQSTIASITPTGIAPGSAHRPGSSLQQKLTKETVSLLPLIGPGSGVEASSQAKTADNYNYIKQFLPSSSSGKRTKSRGKKTRKPKAIPTPTANLEESELLTNLGNYLKKQKQAVSENRHLSYDELLKKAQTNMGIRATAVVASAVVNDIQQQQQQQQYTKPYYHSPTPASYSNRDTILPHTKHTNENDVPHSQQEVYRSQYGKHQPRELYPIVDNEEGEGDEEDRHLIAAKAADNTRMGERSNVSTSQQALLQRRLALEKEIEQYNASYHTASNSNTHISVPENTNLSPSKYSAFRIPEDTNLSPSKKRQTEESSRPSSSAHRQPRKFNMSDALLQSPTLSSGEKTRSKRKLTVKSPPSLHYAGDEEVVRRPGSDEREWNSRFSVRDDHAGIKREAFGVSNEALRESAEDLYHAKQRIQQRQQQEQQQEYSSDYMRPSPTKDKIETSPSPQHQHHHSSRKKLATAGDIDEKFIQNVEMLNVKAPTQLKTTAQAAATSSPRRFIARLLHPFK